MKKNIFIISGVIILAGILVASAVLYKRGKNSDNINSQPADNSSQEQEKVAGANTADYFDENATIMFFYSDLCSWCNKEKEVLAELAKEGYKVKPMNVRDHPDYWQKYSISGTPTFIAKNGDKQVGYMVKEELKKFLDEHK